MNHLPQSQKPFPDPALMNKMDFDDDMGNKNGSGKHKKGCAAVLIVLFSAVILGLSVSASFYYYALQRLPDVSDLRSKASQFETLRIMDRKGHLLYEIIPPDRGRRDYVTLDQMSPYVTACVIAVEDKDYYNHPGFDLRSIIRALFQNAESGTAVSGASTITQQLARNLLMTQNERYEKSISRKIKEIILSTEITRLYSKDEILEIYLNENYYGNFAYGIEAAAQTYFQKPAADLDFAEASFLTGLPQAPGYYDVFNNRDAVMARMKSVLLLIYAQRSENGCIYARNDGNCISIDPLMVSDAIYKIENFDFKYGGFSIQYPHWVNFVYHTLESRYGADSLYRSGYTVYTTLDPDIQDMAETILQKHLSELSSVNANNGAVIVLNPQNGDILAMVGSPDFTDSEHAGQINMTIAPRQPGSAIKPLIYAAAFEKGWTPATLIWDVETDFPPAGKPEDLLYSPPYHPVNYDGTFHGPVLAREALASSLNIPAVKALAFTGIYDDPSTEQADGFIAFARRFHIDSLDKPGFGLSVALGGGEVTLLELTNAYAVFADNGKFIPARSILSITDHNGNTIFEAEEPPAEKILAEEYAFQITSILSDDNARSLGFGTGSVLNLSWPSAVKTGTTNDYRDNWTIGYNSSIVAGIWVGNADNSPMDGATGITGAAPIWHEIMEQAAVMYPEIRSGQFTRPSGITDAVICRDTGAVPKSECSELRWESFAKFQMPQSENESIFRTYYADTWSGKLVAPECLYGADLRRFLNIPETEAQFWITNTYAGHEWLKRIHAEDLEFLPEGDILVPPCGYPLLELLTPRDGSVLTDDREVIRAIVYAQDGFFEYSIEFARQSEPETWNIIQNHLTEPHYDPSDITVWYLDGLENGEYKIRIRMMKENGRYYEKINNVRIDRSEDEFDSPDFYEPDITTVNPYSVPEIPLYTDNGEFYIPPGIF